MVAFQLAAFATFIPSSSINFWIASTTTGAFLIQSFIDMKKYVNYPLDNES